MVINEDFFKDVTDSDVVQSDEQIPSGSFKPGDIRSYYTVEFQLNCLIRDSRKMRAYNEWFKTDIQRTSLFLDKFEKMARYIIGKVSDSDVNISYEVTTDARSGGKETIRHIEFCGRYMTIVDEISQGYVKNIHAFVSFDNDLLKSNPSRVALLVKVISNKMDCLRLYGQTHKDSFMSMDSEVYLYNLYTDPEYYRMSIDDDITHNVTHWDTVFMNNAKTQRKQAVMLYKTLMNFDWNIDYCEVVKVYDGPVPNEGRRYVQLLNESGLMNVTEVCHFDKMLYLDNPNIFNAFKNFVKMYVGNLNYNPIYSIDTKTDEIMNFIRNSGGIMYLIQKSEDKSYFQIFFDGFYEKIQLIVIYSFYFDKISITNFNEDLINTITKKGSDMKDEYSAVLLMAVCGGPDKARNKARELNIVKQ